MLDRICNLNTLLAILFALDIFFFSISKAVLATDTVSSPVKVHGTEVQNIKEEESVGLISGVVPKSKITPLHGPQVTELILQDLKHRKNEPFSVS